MTSVTAFAPATVSNVACGFDVLGFALHEPGDQVTACLAESGVDIADISGDGGRLPREAARNTAGVAAMALLRALGDTRGVSLSIAKGLPLSSGLGGSAASAAAAVVAVNALLGGNASRETLIACALEGESLGAGSAHGDNIAPSICGGFVLVRRTNPPDIVTLPVPAGLTAVVVHPDLEIETAMARALLGDTVPLARCRQAMGQSRRAGPCAAHQRLRAAQPIARRHDCRTEAGAARAGPGAHQGAPPPKPERSGPVFRDRVRRSLRSARIRRSRPTSPPP